MYRIAAPASSRPNERRVNRQEGPDMAGERRRRPSRDHVDRGVKLALRIAAEDNQGVYTKERLLGGPDHYLVTYEVWNYRDSPSSVQLILADPGQAQEDAAGG